MCVCACVYAFNIMLLACFLHDGGVNHKKVKYNSIYFYHAKHTETMFYSQTDLEAAWKAYSKTNLPSFSELDYELDQIRKSVNAKY